VGSDILPGLLNAYQLDPRSATIDITFTHDQAIALRNGTAEIAVMCSTEDLASLHTIHLADENPVALLPARHPLAAHSDVTVAELRQQQAFQERCPATGLDEIIDLVALGHLIVVVGDSITSRLSSTVTAVPVTDLAGTRLLLAWPQLIPTPQLRALIDTARIIRTRQHPARPQGLAG